MTSRQFEAIVATAALAGLLAACSSTVQTTSGSDYIAAYAGDGSNPVVLAAIDDDILSAAAVEPQLRFPARIGIARVADGVIAPVPPADAEQWLALAERLGDGYGSFVPVSPLVIALAMPSDTEPTPSCNYNEAQRCLAEMVRQIRLGAARQHLDAVLIYETFARAGDTSNVLAFTKLALIGFFLPTEDIEADGFANAMLVDVRNGYAYGTASAMSGDSVFRMASSGDRYQVTREANADAQVRAVASLTGEIEAMMTELRVQLAGLPNP